jgi:hypothetical protein
VTFNVGVELGRLAFVVVVLALTRAARGLADAPARAAHMRRKAMPWAPGPLLVSPAHHHLDVT